MGVTILVNGKMTSETVMENKNFQMVSNTRENGKMMKYVVREYTNIVMDNITMGNLKITKSMG